MADLTPAKAGGQAEQSSPRKESGKKKPWVIVITIVIVAALIGGAAYVITTGDEDEEETGDIDLTVTMSPDPIPSVPAGTDRSLSVTVLADGVAVGKTDGVEYSWSVTPTALGSLDFFAQATTTFTAGGEAGEGVVECEITYEGETATVNSTLVVEPPFLDSVSVTPSAKTLVVDEEWDFIAAVKDSVGDVVSDATIEWSVAGIDVGDYALNTTSGPAVSFSASAVASVSLNATATRGDDVVSGSATVIVTTEPTGGRTVDYLWYDMFEPELGPWYDDRWDAYGQEYALTDSYPYLYLWSDDPHSLEGDIWIYTMMRMSVTGRNMPELNMNDNPEFLPQFGDTAGGVAELDWYLQYVTREEAEAKLSQNAYNWFDGWYIGWSGTITLDEQAAKGVLGITTTQFNDFGTWWTSNSGQISTDWQEWLTEEAGPGRLDIFPMYNYYLEFVYFDIEAEKAGDQIVVTLDTISWGMEGLMTRWMGEAFMPTEWYFDDFSLLATIGPEMTDMDVDTAVQYALYAEVSQEDDGALVWGWEGLMQDYVPSDDDHPYSLFDLYEGKEYVVWGPGNEYFGELLEYAYTPGAWNLSEGETLVFEWPAGDQLFFDHDPGNADGLVLNTDEVIAPMTVVYSEPLPSEMPSQMTIDLNARQIVYTGPFDMWTWSKDQTTHQNLSDEWDRLEGVLPWGVPMIEFKADIGGMLAAESVIQGELDDVEAGLDATDEELSSASDDLEGVSPQNLMLIAVLAVPAILAIVMSVKVLSLRRKITETSGKPDER
jgi:flagellar basal body-associated protein FliL